jgi:hypothetical protein
MPPERLPSAVMTRLAGWSASDGTVTQSYPSSPVVRMQVGGVEKVAASVGLCHWSGRWHWPRRWRMIGRFRSRYCDAVVCTGSVSGTAHKHRPDRKERHRYGHATYWDTTSTGQASGCGVARAGATGLTTNSSMCILEFQFRHESARQRDHRAVRVGDRQC